MDHKGLVTLQHSMLDDVRVHRKGRLRKRTSLQEIKPPWYGESETLICDSIRRPSKATTRSPTFHLLTAVPTAAISPDTSRPSVFEAPGGGGYRPTRWKTSGRLTPAARTLISTSPDWGPGLVP